MYNNRGNAYNDLEQYDTAIADYTKANVYQTSRNSLLKFMVGWFNFWIFNSLEHSE
ncbi:tetratricopeptide repeat protein [Waterburya agarophytonicola K14]|uniref:Tetratricopeptide repeat protein n=1 Tax=Waterburya agarophytonicola KI4 TaxID=2874699 RepID=A0A964BM85_9CYAN|nr:tetratricopeptide repeat protein [Waterburya agarophytonicola KI4]